MSEDRAAYKKKSSRPAKKKPAAASAGNGAKPLPIEEKFHEIPVEMIDDPGLQHRLELDEGALHALEKSIQLHGLINPITVVKTGRRYEVVAGFRRLAAFRRLGRVAIPARVLKEKGAGTESLKWHENEFRADLTAMEKAAAFAGMKQAGGLTNREVALLCGVSEQMVGQYLQMFEWPACLQDAVNSGAISFSAGRELARIDDEKELERYVSYAVDSGCTPRLAMQWRSEYDANKNYLRQQQEEAGDPTPPPPVSESLGQCFITGESLPFSKLTIIWIRADLKPQLAEMLNQLQSD